MAENWETISTRGIGFSPNKKEQLVLPPDVTAENLDEYIKNSTLPIADFAIKVVLERDKEDLA